MKTAEEIFEEVYTPGCDGWISFEQAIQAMKLYANQKLDEGYELVKPHNPDAANMILSFKDDL